MSGRHVADGVITFDDIAPEANCRSVTGKHGSDAYDGNLRQGDALVFHHLDPIPGSVALAETKRTRLGHARQPRAIDELG